MNTRIISVREHGFVAQYTSDGNVWHSISGFLDTDLEAACELCLFIQELNPNCEVSYIGIVDIN